jgi:hypothetical protein
MIGKPVTRTVLTAVIFVTLMFLSFSSIGFQRYSAEGGAATRGFPFTMLETPPFLANAIEGRPTNSEIVRRTDGFRDAHIYVAGIIGNLLCITGAVVLLYAASARTSLLSLLSQIMSSLQKR